MKVLVTGAAGKLGAEIVRQLQLRRIECLGTDREDFDVRDGAEVHRAVQGYAPDVIVHCAAYTDVERAETEPEKCVEVNGMGTLNVVRAALAVNAKLMYISDAAVFSGEGTTPWEVNDRPNARSVYGLSKVQGEEAIRSLMTRYFIVRSSWLYGGDGDDLVQTLMRRSGERGEVAVSTTEFGSPTCVSDLARLLCDMLTTERYGVYHAASRGYCSQADLARTVMQQITGRLNLRAVETAPHIGKHPANGRLSTVSLMQGGFALLPEWEGALENYVFAHR